MNEDRKITKKEFLTNRDETGREVVYFPETGKEYYVEYLEPRSYNVTMLHGVNLVVGHQ